MTDPTPYTDDELAPVREQIGKGWNQGISVERRLLATVDAERARAELAEAALALLVGAAESVTTATSGLNRALNQAAIAVSGTPGEDTAVTCRECQGIGATWVEGMPEMVCAACNGTGKRPVGDLPGAAR